MHARRIAICAVLPLLLVVAVIGRAAADSPSHWRPPQSLTWYWQLQGSPTVEPVQATDFDGFDNSAATVASFHAAGQRVICYIDVGTWENWRSDAGSFPSSVLGSDNGWPGERWLDVSQLSILEPIMTARFQMCAQKGYDAVEPDNIDGWENSTGFSITAAQQLTYDEWVASEVHSLGMAVFQKNDPEQATQLEPSFDGALDEQCNEYSECSSYQPYLSAGKPVLNAEYTSSLYPGFCTPDTKLGIMGALFSLTLDGSTFKPCWSSGSAPPTTISTTPPTTTPTTTAPSGTAPADAPPDKQKPRRSASDQANPVVGIGAIVLSNRRGEVGLRLSCPAGQSYCDGKVELDSVKRFAVAGGSRRHPPGLFLTLVLGSTHFHITGGKGATVKFKLSDKALGKFGHAKAVGVVAKASARDAAGRHAHVHRTLRLALR